MSCVYLSTPACLTAYFICPRAEHLNLLKNCALLTYHCNLHNNFDLNQTAKQALLTEHMTVTQ